MNVVILSTCIYFWLKIKIRSRLNNNSRIYNATDATLINDN